jgi:26S proteasome regulatory subunit N2
VKSDTKEVEMTDKDAKEDVDMNDATGKQEGGVTSDSAAPAPKRERRAPEPTSEKLPNMSRVTPAQIAYISFPPDGRFQSVRAVTSSTPIASSNKSQSRKSERYAGGGGILMLIDNKPGEPIQFIERAVDAQAAAPTAEGGAAGQPTVVANNGIPVGINNANAANDADPPPPFEVNTFFLLLLVSIY